LARRAAAHAETSRRGPCSSPAQRAQVVRIRCCFAALLLCCFAALLLCCVAALLVSVPQCPLRDLCGPASAHRKPRAAAVSPRHNPKRKDPRPEAPGVQLFHVEHFINRSRARALTSRKPDAQEREDRRYPVGAAVVPRDRVIGKPVAQEAEDVGHADRPILAPVRIAELP
jgi:hypothetical protein